MYGFVYKWVNSETGEYYIGQHKGNPEDGYVGSGTVFKDKYDNNPELWSRKILKYCDSPEYLNEMEEKCVNWKQLHDPLCLNQIIGGQTTARILIFTGKVFYWVHREHQGFVGTVDELVERFSTDSEVVHRENLVTCVMYKNRTSSGWINLDRYEGDTLGPNNGKFNYSECLIFDWFQEGGDTFTGTCRQMADKLGLNSAWALEMLSRGRRKSDVKGWWGCKRHVPKIKLK